MSGIPIEVIDEIKASVYGDNQLLDLRPSLLVPSTGVPKDVVNALGKNGYTRGFPWLCSYLGDRKPLSCMPSACSTSPVVNHLAMAVIVVVELCMR